MMKSGKFKASERRPIRPEMTVSRPEMAGDNVFATWFSLGADTSITPETYDVPVLYLGGEGSTTFLLGEEGRRVSLESGELLYAPAGTLCGSETAGGSVYTELIIREEIQMNKAVKAGEAITLKNLISYEEGSIANLDIVHTDDMKFVLMAFDEGTGLTPHRAPGNAILTALEGKAIIGYEGENYELNAGECFRFEKNGLHSVTPQGRFKMSLLLVLEKE